MDPITFGKYTNKNNTITCIYQGQNTITIDSQELSELQKSTILKGCKDLINQINSSPSKP